MKIQFADLGLQHKEIKKEINLAIKRVLHNGDYILGKDVKEFEQEFSGFCQAKYGVGVCSGTDALFLALLAIGVKAGDEVIVPSFTYIATALAVSYTGAKPVFVDIEEDTYNINPGLIKKAITRNTKAIIPVHLYGQPANMNEILKIARENNLKVIEDAAQAHGAKIKMDNGNWSRTGGIGDIGCFSFYPSKNLGALGDGGMITTNDESIYKRLLMLRDYGRVSRYEHAIVGYNCRLDTIQAAVLREKLKKLDGWNEMRSSAAKVYDAHFKSVKDVTTPYLRPDVTHVYHCYVVRMPRRDQVFEALMKNEVGAIIHYPIPLHLQKAYEDLKHKKGDFPVAEKVCSEIMSLPMFPHIKETQIKFIVNTIKRALRS